jgi:lysophospholipase L1-like esterase
MIQQIIYIGLSFLLLPCLPFVTYLGRRVKASVLALPEASRNCIGQIKGNNSIMRLLTLGESSMAGVGVTDHQDSITGQFAQHWNAWTGQTVTWQVLAKNGYNAEKTVNQLVTNMPEIAFDLIIIGLGGNDTFEWNRPLTFRKHVKRLIEAVQMRQPEAKIVLINMPPVADFPAFPSLMQFFMGHLVQLHGAVLRDLPQQYSNVFYMNETIRLKDWMQGGIYEAQDFFSDGVHPSALTYALWGKSIADFMKPHWIAE